MDKNEMLNKYKSYKSGTAQMAGVEDKAVNVTDEYEEAQKLYEAKHYEEAYAKFKSLAEKGDAHAQYQLGIAHELGVGAEDDTGKAIEWFLKAAEQGIPLAQYRLATLYLDEDDNDKAAEWYRKATEGLRTVAINGDADTQFMMGMCYEIGYEDHAQALEWWQRAAAQGHKRAQYKVNE